MERKLVVSISPCGGLYAFDLEYMTDKSPQQLLIKQALLDGTTNLYATPGRLPNENDLIDPLAAAALQVTYYVHLASVNRPIVDSAVFAGLEYLESAANPACWLQLKRAVNALESASGSKQEEILEEMRIAADRLVPEQSKYWAWSAIGSAVGDWQRQHIEDDRPLCESKLEQALAEVYKPDSKFAKPLLAVQVHLGHRLQEKGRNADFVQESLVMFDRRAIERGEPATAERATLNSNPKAENQVPPKTLTGDHAEPSDLVRRSNKQILDELNDFWQLELSKKQRNSFTARIDRLRKEKPEVLWSKRIKGTNDYLYKRVQLESQMKLWARDPPDERTPKGPDQPTNT